jgi:organic radical activating enzyme
MINRTYDHHVSLFLTTRCSNECDFCLASASPNKKSFMSLEDVVGVLSGYEGRWKQVSIGGGEPSHVTEAPSIVKWCRDNGWSVLLHTNSIDLAWMSLKTFFLGEGLNSIVVTMSYNPQVPMDLFALSSLREELAKMDDRRVAINVNVFTNEDNNRLIDLGFTRDEVVKTPRYALGRAKSLQGSVPIDVSGRSGHIYTTDLKRFDLADYADACDHQSSLD